MRDTYNFAPSSERYVPQQETFPDSSNVTLKGDVTLPIDSIEKYKMYASEIERTYMVGPMTYHSMTLDLVAIYLKGQKLLYTESKTYCEVLLYTLMLPAIFISTLCTVLSVPLQNSNTGSITTSALNGFNSFLLSIITYLKLDAKADAHKTSAYQFDKLQTMCEFYSGKTLLLHDDHIEKNVNKFIDSLEKKVSEIKDANQFIIPESIRYRYNDIYSYNVFIVMKEYKTSRILNVQKLLDVVNEIQWRKKQVNQEDDITSHNLDNLIKPTNLNLNLNFIKRIFIRKNENSDLDELENVYRKKNIYITGLSDLYKIREICIKDIIKYRNLSSDLNIKFNEQVENHIDETNNGIHRYLFNLDWLRS